MQKKPHLPDFPAQLKTTQIKAVKINDSKASKKLTLHKLSKYENQLQNTNKVHLTLFGTTFGISTENNINLQ